MAKMTVRILFVSFAFGCLFWLIDAVYEYFRFAENLRFMLFHEPLTFADSLLWDIPPHALFTRLVFMGSALAAGALVALVVGRYVASQEALQRTEQRYRTYIENAPDAIFVHDDRARYVEVNQAACELTGYSADELVGMTLGDLLTDDERPAGLRRFNVLREKGKVSGESAYRTKDGRVVDVTLDAVRLDDDRYIAFIKDITESRMLQDQLRQAQKLESIGQLAGGVAHDFNNLLTGVLGNAQLIELGLEDDSPLMPMAEQIAQAATRAADLTKQLLGFARRGRIQQVEVDLHAIIVEVAELLSHSIDRRIEIRTRLRADRPVVLGDPSSLQNVLLNLGVNSRDAMPDGGTLNFITRNVKLDEEFCRQFNGSIAPGGYLEIRVEDTGVGMTPDVQKRVFEPFFTTKRQGQGTGLGLAGAYGTVRSHGGLIRVYSRVGEGTVMSTLLPVGEPNTDRPAAAAVRDEYVYGEGTILLADDEEIVRNFAATALGNLGYTVMTCRDGAEAVDIYRRQHEEIDLVILDLIMPTLSGAEALQRMREIDPTPSFLIASGFAQGNVAAELARSGAGGFILKPFRIEELSREVAHQLGIPRQP